MSEPGPPVLPICSTGQHGHCFGYGWRFKPGHENETPMADNTESGGRCGCWCHMPWTDDEYPA